MSQRPVWIAVVGLLGVTLAMPSAAAERSERLLGSNGNPRVVSDGDGRFRAVIRSDRISFRLRYSDLDNEESDVAQGHIHIANPGNNGPITVFLCSNLPTHRKARRRDPVRHHLENSRATSCRTTCRRSSSMSTAHRWPVLEAGDLAGLATPHASG